MIMKQMTVGMMGVCCYIVACKETLKGLIIDPGGDEEKILAACTENKISVEYIVATHGHPDHVCGNKKIKQATGAKIVMHEADAAFFAKPEIEQYFSMLGLPASPPADVLVKDGDTISIGTLFLQIIHTPGHTPGGICLYQAPHLFTGDTLFVGGVGRTDFPGGDTEKLLNSIQILLAKLPPDTQIWPGHGYGGSSSTLAEEAQDNPFFGGGF